MAALRRRQQAAIDSFWESKLDETSAELISGAERRLTQSQAELATTKAELEEQRLRNVALVSARRGGDPHPSPCASPTHSLACHTRPHTLPNRRKMCASSSCEVSQP